MGGGKTHMMVALGLLARHPHLRPEVLAPELNARIDFANARIEAQERPAPQTVEPHEADTGVNPYDTLGPEILNRHRPKGRSIQSQVKTGGSGNPYDTLAERAPKRRSWDDAFIDTVVRRSDR